MRNTIFMAVILLSFLLFVPLRALRAQDVYGLNEEEALAAAAKAAQPEVVFKHPYGGMRATHEVKYVPGKDNKWFTPDDEVYHYYLAEYYSNGKMSKKSCYTAGFDKLPFTSDDHLQDYFVYEYDRLGGPVKEEHYKVVDGKDVFDFYSLDEHNAAEIKTKVARYNFEGEVLTYVVYGRGADGRLTQDVVYNGRGADGIWFTGDDKIEKYHIREYDKDDRLLRAREYHIDHNGRGADGIWFTGDDVVFAGKELTYGKAPYPTTTLKYLEPGPDGVWFTGDDVLEYYTVRAYTQIIKDK
ncbi:MAG: hypothetical protein PHJ00_03360 [Candidatus Omnitrophica bacterium]|nr:hypothetical protein [Candidatus Omnitrophota bacterium]MDD5654250.1 hypothetical protein [Candidatus Omnitrophota bacterium]